MVVHQPVWIQPASPDASLVTTGQEARQYTRGLLAIGDIAGAQGVAQAGAFQVTQRGAGANLSVDVASGIASVVGDDVTAQGTYQVWNDGTVNVTGITVPGSGTFHHRIVLQVQDKFENSGLWTGYTAAITALLDTGGGLPAEPNSAITLATIDVPTGSSSVTNSMINDFRIQMGTISAVKTADTARSSTTALSDDPDLQLTNLANSVRYRISACIFYTGGSGGGEGDLKFTWRVSSGASGTYAVQQGNIAANSFQQVVGNWTDTNTAGTTGTSNLLAQVFEGQYQPPSRPCTLVYQWAQNTSTSTATTVKANSYIMARRLT